MPAKITKHIKNSPYFVSSNKSNTVFHFQDKGKEYTIYVKNLKSHDKNLISWEFEEDNAFQLPMWIRILFREIHDMYEEQYKDKLIQYKMKPSLANILFMFCLPLEEGSEMDFEFELYIKGRGIVARDVDFVTWNKEWDAILPTFITYLHSYGYKLNILEENQYECYFDIQPN